MPQRIDHFVGRLRRDFSRVVRQRVSRYAVAVRELFLFRDALRMKRRVQTVWLKERPPHIVVEWHFSGFLNQHPGDARAKVGIGETLPRLPGREAFPHQLVERRETTRLRRPVIRVVGDGGGMRKQPARRNGGTHGKAEHLPRVAVQIELSGARQRRGGSGGNHLRNGSDTENRIARNGGFAADRFSAKGEFRASVRTAHARAPAGGRIGRNRRLHPLLQRAAQPFARQQPRLQRPARRLRQISHSVLLKIIDSHFIIAHFVRRIQ